MQFFAWLNVDGFHTAVNCEGDITHEVHDTAAEASEWLDDHIHWSWGRGWATPRGFVYEAPLNEHRGPFAC
jgi:hypothetical protein